MLRSESARSLNALMPEWWNRQTRESQKLLLRRMGSSPILGTRKFLMEGMWHMKSKIIKELKARGIRYADKEGVGRVKLEHLKFPQLANLLGEIIAKENQN